MDPRHKEGSTCPRMKFPRSWQIGEREKPVSLAINFPGSSGQLAKRDPPLFRRVNVNSS
jgi:hypothetical protein